MLDSQRCGHPWCWLGRCCVSRTRWARGDHVEARTPTPLAHRRPPPRRWGHVGNHLSGLRKKKKKKHKKISFVCLQIRPTDRQQKPISFIRHIFVLEILSNCFLAVAIFLHRGGWKESLSRESKLLCPNVPVRLRCVLMPASYSAAVFSCQSRWIMQITQSNME